MPTFDQYDKEVSLARIMPYGKAKTRKTTWASMAAEAGYRVLILDGDKGTKVIRNLTPAARSRIYVIDLQDTPSQPIFTDFIRIFSERFVIAWDEINRKAVPLYPEREGITYIDANQFGRETLVLLDSWSTLADSLYLRFSLDNNIDMADAKKTDWPGFGWAGRSANLYLQRLCALPCHLCVIAHATQYEKYKKKQIGNKEVQLLEYSRKQIKSTSGPHAMTVPARFDHMLEFVQISSALTQIDARGDVDKDAGSRSLPPQVFNWSAQKLELPIWDDRILDGQLTEPAPAFDFSNPPVKHAVPIPAQGEKPVIPSKPATGKNRFNFGES